MSAISSQNIRVRFTITHADGTAGGQSTVLIVSDENHVKMMDEVLQKCLLSDLIKIGDRILMKCPQFQSEITVNAIKVTKPKGGTDQ